MHPNAKWRDFNHYQFVVLLSVKFHQEAPFASKVAKTDSRAILAYSSAEVHSTTFAN